MSRKPYQLVEHTADVGLRVRADTLNRLFEAGGEAVADLLAGEGRVRGAESVEVSLEAEEAALLFREWLSELIYLFDAKGFVGAGFSVEVTGKYLNARVEGEGFDPARHETELYIKGVTYHQLSVEQVPDGWEAFVILDV
jgi:SHS2 domain-containing protein